MSRLLDGPKLNTLTTLARNNISFTMVDGTPYDEPTVIIQSCVTNKTKCEAGTPVAVEVAPNITYKFYVLNDDTTKNEVTLIMDRNLYSPEELENETHNVLWISLEDYIAAGGTAEEYGEDGKNNKGPLTALRVLKERTSGWTNIPSYSYTLKNDDDGEGGEYTYPDITGELVTNVRARLPKFEELIKFKNQELSYGKWISVNWLKDNLEGYYTWKGIGFLQLVLLKIM